MAPSWCKCGRCREMGADIDNKCCGCLPRNCVSTRDEMERLVLDPQVLALGQSFYSDMLARRGQRVENTNKTMRYSAYRNFTLWRHGRLGAGVRRVVPSCCVLSIRARYPSATGTYTGFVPGRFV
ncbi:P2X purinoceptor 7-like [Ruditapes philippinarum]|uniref:P2X purinoceptor 7-like n=1 Tax=Ruditapes philippinarum TaxID=129788 RepID=UPI00295C196B|nr:P2X purinoceptor 7-like [Ruditapes philippinarum]